MKAAYRFAFISYEIYGKLSEATNSCGFVNIDWCFIKRILINIYLTKGESIYDSRRKIKGIKN